MNIFYSLADNFSTCTLISQKIQPDVDLYFQETSGYGGGYNPHVTKIIFVNCEMIKIPKGLKNTFQNLMKIELQNTTLETLTKLDLAEYKNFTEFRFVNNKIEFLPGDLYEGFVNLERIAFEENNLNFIEPSILDGLDNLKYVDFGPNYRTDPNIVLSDPNLVQDLLNENITTQPVEEWMKHQLSARMIRNFYNELQILYDNRGEQCQNLTLQIENLKAEHEKEKELFNKSLNKDINTFVQDETTKDFRIQIDDHEFPVHKFLLAARSPTLAEILKNNPEVENLNLVDISVEIFEIILKFLYTDELPGDDGTNFFQLFAAAGKLKIQELKKFAAEKIYDLIDTKNMLDALKLGNKYDDNLMRQKAFSKVKEKYPIIEYKDEWINDSEKVEKMLKFFKDMEEKEAILKQLME